MNRAEPPAAARHEQRGRTAPAHVRSLGAAGARVVRGLGTAVDTVARVLRVPAVFFLGLTLGYVASFGSDMRGLQLSVTGSKRVAWLVMFIIVGYTRCFRNVRSTSEDRPHDA